jgi:hypothetical protein
MSSSSKHSKPRLPSGLMIRTRGELFLAMCDFDPSLDGILPRSNIPCIIRLVWTQRAASSKHGSRWCNWIRRREENYNKDTRISGLWDWNFRHRASGYTFEPKFASGKPPPLASVSEWFNYLDPRGLDKSCIGTSDLLELLPLKPPGPLDQEYLAHKPLDIRPYLQAE